MADQAMQSVNAHTRKIFQNTEHVMKVTMSLIETVESLRLKLRNNPPDKTVASLTDRLAVSIDLYERFNTELLQFKFDLKSVSSIAEYYGKIRENVEQERNELAKKIAAMQKEKISFEKERMIIEKERTRLLRELGSITNFDYFSRKIEDQDSECISKQLGKQIKEIEKALNNREALEDELKQTKSKLKSMESRNNELEKKLRRASQQSEGDRSSVKESCENSCDGDENSQRKIKHEKETNEPDEVGPILETLAEFNARLQDELYSLKQENIHLTISANEARSAMYHAKNQLSVSIRDREDLRTRINRLTMQNRRLEYALRVRAENEVNTRNLQHKENEQMRWKEVRTIKRLGIEGGFTPITLESYATSNIQRYGGRSTGVRNSVCQAKF
ncbi:predicted protein [Nematostella vectensis]|uniref:Uncharacterized protein n=1 Tax=Nematostella vectensis TaxID=45351 RepID=A7S8H3_NEMVE|nr:predicted protein [Nematostella vectensis]|eukprot:XP_001632049.1 predicted protein [Nematostella vectensis]